MVRRARPVPVTASVVSGAWLMWRTESSSSSCPWRPASVANDISMTSSAGAARARPTASSAIIADFASQKIFCTDGSVSNGSSIEASTAAGMNAACPGAVASAIPMQPSASARTAMAKRPARCARAIQGMSWSGSAIVSYGPNAAPETAGGGEGANISPCAPPRRRAARL